MVDATKVEEVAVKTAKINLSDIVVMEGKSKKNGEDYCFLKLDGEFANNTAVIEQFKEAGVRMSGQREAVAKSVEIS